MSGPLWQCHRLPGIQRIEQGGRRFAVLQHGTVLLAHEAFADDVIEKNDEFLVETVPLPQPQGFAVVAERALCCTPNRRERSA